MELLKLEPGRTQYVPQYDADCYFTRGENGVIEFIVPRSGVLTKFNKGLGGLHHIALQVEDLDQRSAEMRSKGIELLEAKPVERRTTFDQFPTPGLHPRNRRGTRATKAR